MPFKLSEVNFLAVVVANGLDVIGAGCELVDLVVMGLILGAWHA